MPRRTHHKKLSLEEIHAAVRKGIKSSEEAMDTSAHLDPLAQAFQSFQDQLHALSMHSRPKTIEDIHDYTEMLTQVIRAAGEDSESWKLLLLTLIKRRYHSKAPENKELRLKRKNDGLDGDQEKSRRMSRSNNGGRGRGQGGRGRGRGGGRGHGSGPDVEVDNGDGDGERLILYLAMIILTILAKKGSEYAGKASQCLAVLALPAGGTRDLCAFLEHLIYVELYDQDLLQDDYEKGQMSTILQKSMKHLGTSLKASLETPSAMSVLDELLDTCALLVDRDLKLVRQTSTSPKELPSTIHTFIPHRDRGTKSRNVVQTVAEILIWSRCTSAMQHDSFSSAWDSMKECEEDSFIKSLHGMQTTIRRLRKELNDSARANGFSLYTSFRMDPSTINLPMLKKGKEGDVVMIRNLAAKAHNNKVLTLIGARMTDPEKAIATSSISSLMHSWIPLNKEDTSMDDQEKEMNELQLKIQEATVRATIEKLRKAMPKSKDAATDDTMTTVASLDNTVTSDASAVLIAAALDTCCTWKEPKNTNDEENDKMVPESSQVQLFIGEEQWNVSDPTSVMQRLDNIFSSSRERASNADEVATTKAVQNLIERHLKPNGQLILFASADVKLEARILSKLQKDNSTIHCHINDEFSRRMNREKAKVGDVTCTLLWNDYSDLDLHLHCPDGSHISYQNKEACGGYLDVDMNAGGAQSEEPVENVFFGDAEKNIEAMHGKYKVVVQNYSYHGSKLKNPDPVPFKVRVLMDGKESVYTGACTGSGGSSNQTVVEFEYNGRTAPAAKETAGAVLESSNLVSVTSSVGETIDALQGLMKLKEQVEQLNTVRDLTIESDDTAMESNETNNERPIEASAKAYDITSRDRLYLNLSRLPFRFHQEVARSFGGNDLMDIAASEVAARLVKDKIKLEELKKSGYPSSIFERVKVKMGTFGV